MSPQTSLTVLTFVGLAITFSGVAISQLTKTSDEIGGKKKLTRAGRVALAIAVLGFAGSFGSEVIKASVKAQEHMQSRIDASLRAQKEREDKDWQGRSEDLQQKINIDTASALTVAEEHLKQTVEGFTREQEAILNTRLEIANSRQQLLADNLLHETKLYAKLGAAGTPLTSMTIRLTFDHVPRDVIDQVLRAQALANKETGDAQAGAEHDQTRQYYGTRSWDRYRTAAMYRAAIQPFIQLLAADRFEKQDGILGIGLDKRFSALACVGWIENGEIVPEVRGGSPLPSGVMIDDETGPDFLDLGGSRSAMRIPRIQLNAGNDSIEFLIELDIFSFDDSVWRFTRSERSAALPDDIEMFSWAARLNEELSEEDLKQLELPFDSRSVHSSVLDVDLNRNQPADRRMPDHIGGQDKAWEQRNAIWLKSNSAWVEQMPRWMREMRLQLIPNGISEISKTYRLTLSSSGYPAEGSRETFPRGYVRIWHGRAIKS